MLEPSAQNILKWSINLPSISIRSMVNTISLSNAHSVGVKKQAVSTSGATLTRTSSHEYDDINKGAVTEFKYQVIECLIFSHHSQNSYSTH
ncbi:hypothetical protein Syun_010060 [Stephania yunnanensis]|uniref:Uncharacterized protein n=1 Tax=Stephania yunnanensis TaxID=152371 RepID=A0AAP0PSX1_9MAGN